MDRKIDRYLDDWQTRKDRLPLLIFGARQTGKTYSVIQFAKRHDRELIYLNFEQNNKLCGLFEDRIDANTILSNLEIYFSKKINPETTLIFLDEIQLCERALTALKYLAEEAPQYMVIASGSLLGVMINREKYSFPVGKITIVKLQPMDLEEFLWAMDQQLLVQAIRQAYDQLAPLPEPIHEKALEMLDHYLYIGGMPAVLNAYLSALEDRDDRYILDVTDEKKSDLLTAYLADMVKYSSATEANRTAGAFRSIPAQFAKENHKFQYKPIQNGASSSLFGSSLDWLENAGIISRCYRLNTPVLPLPGNVDYSAFKVYLHDCGLLAKMLGASPGTFLLANMDGPSRGAVIENYVASSLLKIFESIYYWEYKSQAEIDFVVQIKDQAVPIEVKAGHSVKAKSLQSYRTRFSPGYAIRFSRKNFGKTDTILAIPLYAIFCLKT